MSNFEVEEWAKAAFVHITQTACGGNKENVECRTLNVEFRSGGMDKSGMHFLSHDVCNAGIRPEGPAVNRPGRRAGISE
jgi:hypothetical protein